MPLGDQFWRDAVHAFIHGGDAREVVWSDDSITIVDRSLTCIREHCQVYRWPPAIAPESRGQL